MSIFADDRIIFTIQNSTDYIFQSISMNFDSGEYKSGGALPTQLNNFGAQATAYMGDKFGLAGVSGYLSFTMNGATQWLYLSSPYLGRNKIGYGTSQSAAYTQAGQNFDNYGYNPFTQTITVQGVNYTLQMSTTSGDARTFAIFTGPL